MLRRLLAVTLLLLTTLPAWATTDASDRLHAMLEADHTLSSALAAGLGNGARLLVAETPSSPLYDFFFGLTANWFSSGLLQDFPIGRLATEAEWQRRLSSLAADRHRLVSVPGPYGPLLLMEVPPGPRAGQAQLPPEAIAFRPLGCRRTSLLCADVGHLDASRPSREPVRTAQPTQTNAAAAHVHAAYRLPCMPSNWAHPFVHARMAHRLRSSQAQGETSRKVWLLPGVPFSEAKWKAP